MNLTIPIVDAESAQIQRAIAQHRQTPGALLPILHAIQDVLGYIPKSAASQLAQALNLSRAEVHGVISYYHYFRQTPPGKHSVSLCQAEACRARGAENLMHQAEQMLACTQHQTRADQMVDLEPVYCLGLCASSPAMKIGERLFARLDAEKMRSIFAAMELTQEPQS